MHLYYGNYVNKYKGKCGKGPCDLRHGNHGGTVANGTWCLEDAAYDE